MAGHIYRFQEQETKKQKQDDLFADWTDSVMQRENKQCAPNKCGYLVPRNSAFDET